MKKQCVVVFLIMCSMLTILTGCSNSVSSTNGQVSKQADNKVKEVKEEKLEGEALLAKLLKDETATHGKEMSDRYDATHPAKSLWGYFFVTYGDKYHYEEKESKIISPTVVQFVFYIPPTDEFRTFDVEIQKDLTFKVIKDVVNTTFEKEN